MKKIIDISLPLKPDIPVWPDSIGFHITPTKTLEAGDEANLSRLECDVHVGTHIDAPGHFIKGGNAVEQIDLDNLIGPAWVAFLPDVKAVTADDLNKLELSAEIRRLLLKTRNSELWARGETEFKKDFVALTPDAAQWIVDKGINLIGIDYLSIQCFGDSPLTHRILLESDVIILEGLNLCGVHSGIYELICLPLNLVGAEGAPARAVLQTME